ncbi:hypothetical protein AMATHDRAFT_2965 [Amanita thiersii Skay4041]|uniref:Tyrosine--tRNA ligase n=1 Tax=Amanita thiersii Skay4041 TaxID=703135 RepID=A0A2A9NN33_9AGAR|nr:hypothetical protein AMATHDRAFT_2965 [Amanita thiersii Skay4041]
MLRRWTRQLPRQCERQRYYSTPPPTSILLSDLTERGFIQDVTRPQALHQALRGSPRSVYAGIDPTAQSLHIGHLLPLIGLLHFQIHGHTIIPLIGGATGRIGDPSGRNTERKLADLVQVEDNVAGLTQSIRRFFTRASHYTTRRLASTTLTSEPVILSNLEWHQHLTMLDFLRTVGVHARINTMVNRESVKARLASQHGISFTEFTYQLLQAYDFYHLYRHHNCSIQIGGSDQWGNILAGLELISRLEGPTTNNTITTTIPADYPEQAEYHHIDAYGITTPLLTTASGEKFGKSAGNAVWLDPSMTSVFDFYQYFIKVADADVERYLKMFTLIPLQEITELVHIHNTQPEKRIAQRRLAAEVTDMVHTPEGLNHAETLTKLLFDSDYSSLQASKVIHALQNDPRLVLVSEADMLQTPLPKLAAKHGLVSSNCKLTVHGPLRSLELITLFLAAARTLVQARGFYLNNTPVPDAHFTLTRHHLIDNRIAILRAGKDRLLILAMNPGQ